MTFQDLATVVHGTVVQVYNPHQPVRYLLTDSRRGITSAEVLFFAIDGVHHDGHQFIAELYRRGVRQFITEKPLPETWPDANILQVDHGIAALQRLAAWHRQQFAIPVVGLTGSNGKTIIKEWLNQLLSPHVAVVMNPKSYNSQIGVPLSVWQLNARHQLGIFEAGISQPGEMAKLVEVMRPTVGIFTNIGPAHDEGFTSRQQKIEEKAQLFEHAEAIIYRQDAHDIDAVLRARYPQQSLYTWSFHGDSSAHWQVQTVPQDSGTRLTVQAVNQLPVTLHVPFQDAASLENVMHCIAYLLYANYDATIIQAGLSTLRRVSMRMELKQGINYCYLIDDSYSNDLASLQMGLDFLNQQSQNERKTVILSDVLQTGQSDQELYEEVLGLLQKNQVHRFIGIGPKMQASAAIFDAASFSSDIYESTEQFLQRFDSQSFSHENILIKGARTFALEKIVARLQQKIHGTVMEINLDAVTHNLNYYRSKLLPGVKVLGVVKALSYGGAAFEIASLLQYHQIDYLAVAYADEGIMLREQGIRLPILVLNPSPESFEKMVTYRLEPEIYSFGILQKFLDAVPYLLTVPPIHLKLDTGMHRLGFAPEEWEKLVQTLSQHPTLKVASILSHMVASDEAAHDEFTHQQVRLFQQGYTQITAALGYQPLAHIANTVGAIRFPDYQFDMVRLGGGLYGVDTWGEDPSALGPVATLKTVVSQVKHIKAGETIGYARQGITQRETQIATIAIGYADGFDRRFGNGTAQVTIRGQQVPTIGRICMDMTMVDVTGLEVAEGDEVTIFHDQASLYALAQPLGTIPYEILTKVSERVKRVYYRE